MRRSVAEIVHIHLPNPLAIVSYLASGHKGRLVLSYHSDVIRQRGLNTLYEPLLRRAMERCSALICASPDYIDSSPLLRSVRSRCHVIPYGINIGEFDNPDLAEVTRLQQRFGPNIIVAVGRLVYYKGFEHLIRAMVNVQGHLVLLGSGPLRADLEQLTGKLSVCDKVTFAGSIDNLVPYYHAADVFVLPSVVRSEAFGIVQLEAMACRKPVINTSIDSGVPWVSLHETTGLTVPPGDSAALAAAINQLLGSPALRQKYGAAGRDRVEQEFTSAVMRSRMLNLYRSIVHSPSAPRQYASCG